MARQLGGCQAGGDLQVKAAGLAGGLLTMRLLVLAPHMDDETLGCGGTMLMHTHKDRIHCLFATDGAASPAPLLPWQGRADAGLRARRRREALSATGKLGVSPENLHFLDLPDGRLSAHRSKLIAAVGQLVRSVQPDYVLAPFRFDVHPDHTALNRAARSALRSMPAAPVMLEYFVYHRLRFVPGGDVRGAIDEDALVTVDTMPAAEAKRAALESYVSQTALLYAWQDRPILTEHSLARRCSEVEVFLRTNPAAALTEGLASHAWHIRLASSAMRFGKRPKDRSLAFVRWMQDQWRRR